MPNGKRPGMLSFVSLALPFTVLTRAFYAWTHGSKNATTDFYVGLGGTQFVEASFATSPLIHCTTRRYRHFLEEQFPQAFGSLLDFGCGDGRLSLWAAKKGFPLVVAADSNIASLKRLAAESRRQSLFELANNMLRPGQAAFRQRPFRRRFFASKSSITLY